MEIFIKIIMGELTPRQRVIFKKKFSNKERSFQSIADDLGTSRQSIETTWSERILPKIQRIAFELGIMDQQDFESIVGATERAMVKRRLMERGLIKTPLRLQHRLTIKKQSNISEPTKDNSPQDEGNQALIILVIVPGDISSGTAVILIFAAMLGITLLMAWAAFSKRKSLVRLFLIAVVMVVSISAFAQTNTAEAVMTAGRSSDIDWETFSQLFNGAAASLIAALMIVIIVFVSARYQNSQSIHDAPSRSLVWNVLTHLGKDVWIVIAATTPYIVFGFYSKVLLIVMTVYVLMRMAWRFYAEINYLKQIKAKMSRRSVLEEMAIDAKLKAKAEEKRAAIEDEERTLINKAKEDKKAAAKTQKIAVSSPHPSTKSRPIRVEFNKPKAGDTATGKETCLTAELRNRNLESEHTKILHLQATFFATPLNQWAHQIHEVVRILGPSLALSIYLEEIPAFIDGQYVYHISQTPTAITLLDVSNNPNAWVGAQVNRSYIVASESKISVAVIGVFIVPIGPISNVFWQNGLMRWAFGFLWFGDAFGMVVLFLMIKWEDWIILIVAVFMAMVPTVIVEHFYAAANIQQIFVRQLIPFEVYKMFPQLFYPWFYWFNWYWWLYWFYYWRWWFYPKRIHIYAPFVPQFSLPRIFIWPAPKVLKKIVYFSQEFKWTPLPRIKRIKMELKRFKNREVRRQRRLWDLFVVWLVDLTNDFSFGGTTGEWTLNLNGINFNNGSVFDPNRGGNHG